MSFAVATTATRPAGTVRGMDSGKTEITNGQYGFLLQKYHEGEVNLPVVDATWENAEAAPVSFEANRGRV